jgi:cob(I)alamin adenosyltransferase
MTEAETIASAVNEMLRQKTVDRDRIEALDKRNKELEAALREIADGPLDADKSYVSLLHELRSKARAVLEGEKTND